QLAVVVELVGQADHVVVDIPEVDDLVLTDQLLVAIGQLVEHLADGADRAPDADQLTLQVEQRLERIGGRLAHDLVLDLVDGVADAVRRRDRCRRTRRRWLRRARTRPRTLIPGPSRRSVSGSLATARRP